MSETHVSEVGPLSAWTEIEGVAPGKAFLEADLGSEFLGLSVNATLPGDESPFWHVHNKIEEVYFVIEGEGEIALDDRIIPLHPGTVVNVRPGIWRALRCLPDSDVPLKWLCIRGGGESLEAIGNDAELDQERPYPWS